MPINQRNGARFKSRDPEESNQRNGACPRGGRNPDAELGCSEHQQNGVCARGSTTLKLCPIAPCRDKMTCVTMATMTTWSRAFLARMGHVPASLGRIGMWTPRGRAVVVRGKRWVGIRKGRWW